MVQELSISERRACRYAGLSRTSYRQPPSMNESTASLSTRIIELAHECRRFGYRRIHDLLSLEGHHVNHKCVWRGEPVGAQAPQGQTPHRRAPALDEQPPCQ